MSSRCLTLSSRLPGSGLGEADDDGLRLGDWDIDSDGLVEELGLKDGLTEEL